MFTHVPENQPWLRDKWQALVTAIDADRTAGDAVWDELIRHYSEPQRLYHNLSHIMVLLRYAETHRHQIQELETVELAIWFHDVIYDTHLPDNERRSAAWSRRAMMAMQIEKSRMLAVLQCIVATENHELAASHMPDLPLFLDMDIAILGSRENIYKEYSELIRAEYGWMPIEQYRLGRGKFLQTLLARPTIFLTPAMAELEHQARLNLAAEWRELSHLTTP